MFLQGVCEGMKQAHANCRGNQCVFCFFTPACGGKSAPSRVQCSAPATRRRPAMPATPAPSPQQQPRNMARLPASCRSPYPERGTGENPRSRVRKRAHPAKDEERRRREANAAGEYEQAMRSPSRHAAYHAARVPFHRHALVSHATIPKIYGTVGNGRYAARRAHEERRRV